MNVGQSPQTGIVSPRDLASPTTGTRTRTVREYEQTISELKKENFDLKLHLYMCKEAVIKNFSKDKDGNPVGENPVDVIVKLNSETESLRKELCYKEKLLQDALERAEKWEKDFKELENKYAELESELASLSELPSKEEYLALVEEKENLTQHAEFLEKALTEKEEELHGANQKIEILADKNRILEEKIEKKSLAIQGFVCKTYKEKEMLPDELKNVVISAMQAAKNGNKEELVKAVKNTHTILNKIMSSAQVLKSQEKENVCLKEETFEKPHSFLANKKRSSTELSHIQVRKES